MKGRPVLTGFFIIGVLFLLFILAIIATVFLFGKEGFLPVGEKIAVVEIKGVISESRPIVEELQRFRKTDRVKGIIVRINSPGGGVGPSQEIYKEVTRAAKVKKVVASLGPIAASGGYYIACGADKIISNPGTITGSIGVLVEVANIRELLDKIGLRREVIKSAAHKDMGSPLREMTPEEKKLLQGVVDDIHSQFVTAVAEGRGLSVDQVRELSDGRVFSGRQAYELGLVDQLGDLQDAVDLIAEMAGIEGEPSVIYSRGKGFSLLDYLISRTTERIIQEIDQRRFAISYRYSPHP